MWFLNKRQGTRWDADPVTAKRLASSPDYEPCEPPQATANETSGGSVLSREKGMGGMPYALPPEADSQSPSNTDDASQSTNRTDQPDSATGQPQKRSRKNSRASRD